MTQLPGMIRVWTARKILRLSLLQRINDKIDGDASVQPPSGLDFQPRDLGSYLRCPVPEAGLIVKLFVADTFDYLAELELMQSLCLPVPPGSSHGKIHTLKPQFCAFSEAFRQGDYFFS